MLGSGFQLLSICTVLSFCIVLSLDSATAAPSIPNLETVTSKEITVLKNQNTTDKDNERATVPVSVSEAELKTRECRKAYDNCVVTILTRQDEIPYVERCKGYEKCTELYFICDLDKQSQSGTGIEPDVESNQNSTLETRILS